MRKKWLKRAMSTALALLMTVGLCACGGGAEGTNGEGTSGGKKDNKGNANSALAKENVYKVNEFDIPQFVDEENGYVNAQCTVHLDDKVYILLQVQDWSKDTAEQTQLKLMTMKDDGSDVQVKDLELPKQDKKDDGESAEAQESETSEDETVAGEESSSYEYTSYGNFTMTADGKVYGVRQYDYNDYSNPEAYTYETHQYLCCWNLDGNFLWETELEGIRSDEENAEWIYIRNVSVAKDGSLNLLLGGDNTYLMNVSADGVASEKKKLSDETTSVLNNNQYMVQKEDGTFSIIYNDENDWAKTFMADYDMDADTLGEPTEIPSNLTWYGFNTVTAGKSSDIVYTNSNGVYSYSKGDTESKIRMNFVNSDVNITNFLSLTELTDKSFLGLYNENYESVLKGAVFTYVDPQDIPDKTVLVLAGNYVGSDMKKRVIEYNRANDEYRIVLKEYDSYNSYDDYEAGFTKLNNDIITGSMPDILIADNLPIDNYISKGLIADVGKLIEQDEELSQVEFMQNVFDAFSVDGKLYYVVPQFNVVTMAAKTSLVGDGSDWSMERMKQILADMGEGTQAIGEVTRDGFMSMAMQYCGRDFIDVETGKCSFDSDDFIAMMEFANTLPEEINWDELYGNDDYWTSYESQYRDNRTLLLQVYIGSFDNLSYQLNGYLGDDFTFVGFPTAEGSGSYISSYGSMVLSARSKNLEGAWDFARYYLTNEYQESLQYTLPVNKECFMRESQKATKRPTYTDYETNELIEYDNTMYINGEEVIIPPLNQEQLDQVVQYIESVNTPYYYNEDVLNIVNEEMGSFYSGQKTARDAAAIIQSRAQLYVDENR